MSELIKAKSPNLGFGNMRMPKKADGTVDTELIFKMVDTYMDHGYNYFDTAYTYKGSEEMLRKALVERYPRDSYTVTTKLQLGECENHDDMMRQFNISRERLGLDYVDVYFLHGLGPKTYDKVERLKPFDFLRELRDMGLTKHIGFSFHGNAEKLEELLTANPDVELVQLQLNYLDWEDPKVQSRLCYEVARKHGVPISVMEPCKGGWLAGNDSEAARLLLDANPNVSTASWAFRFVAGLEGIHVILSGMGNLEQVEDNVHTFDTFQPLSEEERALTLKAVDIINSIPCVPCTDCQYCVRACPQNLPIPFFMRSYNSLLMFNAPESSKHTYNMLTTPETKASQCLDCHNCEQRCPQGIEITKYVHFISDKYDKD